MAKLAPLENDPEFEPDAIKKGSVAACGICKWVRAMIVYDQAKRRDLGVGSRRLAQEGDADHPPLIPKFRKSGKDAPAHELSSSYGDALAQTWIISVASQSSAAAQGESHLEATGIAMSELLLSQVVLGLVGSPRGAESSTWGRPRLSERRRLAAHLTSQPAS